MRLKCTSPEHVRRFLKNRAKIPHTHFSMLNEIYLNLFVPLEDYLVRAGNWKTYRYGRTSFVYYREPEHRNRTGGDRLPEAQVWRARQTRVRLIHYLAQLGKGDTVSE
jgi:hypothetical protein